jgi:DNA processing protein
VRLYVWGRLPKDGVAVIGSRTPPAEAAEFAYRLAFNLNEPIVAGLAPGIDAAAHRGALAAGTPTVAFVGYGFGRTDPPEHAELAKAIVDAGGAIATLEPPGTPASEESRIARDRLQADHARAVVLVCTEIAGGAMYTMRFARDFGRPRFAVSPPMEAAHPEEWAGNRQCIEEGATPLPFEVDAAISVLARTFRPAPKSR